jgi:L-threonylcarbamoyladenylate synthase
MIARMAIRVHVRASQLTGRGVLRTGDVQAITEILVDRGGFALLPSDTCYSLAARPVSPDVSVKINKILHREQIPISLAFDTVTRVGQWIELTTVAARLLEELTPGALTVVCRLTEEYEPAVQAIVNDVLLAPDQTIGVRIPDSPIETQLVSACDFPLTTVAVRTRDRAQRAVTDFEEARAIVEKGIRELGEPVPLALIETNQEFSPEHSTVVRVAGLPRGVTYEVIRPGAVALERLDHAINKISNWETRMPQRGARR